MSYVIGMDISEVSDTPTFNLGQKGMNDDGNTYKYVQYDTGAGSVAAVSGQVAYYYAPSGASAGAVNVCTSDLSDSAEIGAGVLQSAPTDGQYAWIQIGGTTTMSIALTAGADGDPLTPTGSADGTLDVIAAGAANTAICAYAIDAGGAAPIIALAFMG
tara:strand:- start:24 stop:500 length:477 start_codon:yes stop_codon:yes gene_type:complete